ncbi:MAG: transglycosylase SLT domain-containing protein [Desulfovibrio sp.]|nr:transglycosylase SLT domain-containing protein [Desulfovibrio sp.]
MKIRHTLCVLALSTAALLAVSLLLSGFVPRDEGAWLRRPASFAVAQLTWQDMPSPIQSQGDGQRLWAYRGPCVLESLEKDLSLPSMDEQSGPVRFRAKSVVLAWADNSPQEPAPACVAVPLLALDGFSQPLLYATMPLSYGDLTDASGQPLSWFSDQTLQMGYTPLALHRAPLSEAFEPQGGVREYAAQPVRRYFVRGRGLERAAAFQGLVRTFAKRSGLDPMLVNAIIYSESNFNTTLVSPRSAVGLMQILPRTAGSDVHRFLYGSRTTIASQDLFDPETNIRYGTAYLQMLMQRYFSGVRDAQSREYCTVAAYNMGPGRVIRVFGPTAQVAASRINELSSEEVFNWLLTRLPRQETRSYVAKVRSLKQQYASMGLAR